MAKDTPVSARQRIAGIYRISLNDDRCYVGQSVDIYDRWKGHRSKLRNNKNASPILQAAWNKYGENAFTFDVLECVDVTGLNSDAVVELLCKREQFWMDALRPKFNILPQAGSHSPKPWSAESRAKMSVALSGRSLSAEHRRRLSEVQKGRPRKSLSAETRAKISEANRGRPGGFTGKTHTPEAAAKISVGLRQHTRTAEHRANIAAAKIGVLLSNSHRANISASHRGKPWSEARRQSWLRAQPLQPPKGKDK